jgi:hypothetical protein
MIHSEKIVFGISNYSLGQKYCRRCEPVFMFRCRHNNTVHTYNSMNYSRLLLTIFLTVGGVLVFAIWGNIYAYAQQSSTASSPSTIISPELKAKMCNPSNPDLKIVNTTEARICGIAKTVKPPLASAATPKTISSPLTRLPNSTGSGSSNTGVTTNVPIVLKPLPGGTCPQGYHLVSGSVCIKDLPSAAQTKTTPTASLPTATTNATIQPPRLQSSSTTSQPSDTSSNDKNANDNSDNQENFKTKILKSFNKKFK